MTLLPPPVAKAFPQDRGSFSSERCLHDVRIRTKRRGKECGGVWEGRGGQNMGEKALLNTAVETHNLIRLSMGTADIPHGQQKLKTKGRGEKNQKDWQGKC